MPATMNGGGDQLARGAARATFRPAGEKVSREKWDEMFGDFDPEAYKAAPPMKDENGIKANSSGGFADTTEESNG
jgi:hypothetical protein